MSFLLENQSPTARRRAAIGLAIRGGVADEQLSGRITRRVQNCYGKGFRRRGIVCIADPAFGLESRIDSVIARGPPDFDAHVRQVGAAGVADINAQTCLGRLIVTG